MPENHEYSLDNSGRTRRLRDRLGGMLRRVGQGVEPTPEVVLPDDIKRQFFLLRHGFFLSERLPMSDADIQDAEETVRRSVQKIMDAIRTEEQKRVVHMIHTGVYRTARTAEVVSRILSEDPEHFEVVESGVELMEGSTGAPEIGLYMSSQVEPEHAVVFVGHTYTPSELGIIAPNFGWNGDEVYADLATHPMSPNDLLSLKNHRAR